MRAFVANTDLEWFTHLSRLTGVDEVNFWMPRPWGGEFRVLSRGEPLLFKLKKPHNAIAGLGFFEHYSELPLSLAWDTFGQKNGVSTLADLRGRIARLRHQQLAPWVDDAIGCILLVEPVFWPRELWIPEPEDWKRNIVRGKTYDLTLGMGRRLWEEVAWRLQTSPSSGAGDPGGREWEEAPGRPAVLPGGYGDPFHVRRRVGQGTFRAVITDAYGRRCAVTEEKALPVLEAAHIRPFHVEPEHYVQNGILLRSDIHRLFDAGYVTVTDRQRLEVSGRLRDDFNDGENYGKFHGAVVRVPVEPDSRPDPENLRWHNDHVFRG